MELMRIGYGMNRAPRVRWALGLFVVWILTVSAWPAGARGQTQGPGEPAAPKSSLGRYVPRQDLVFYLEFDGLDAHGEAWQKSAAYKLLNDTKLGALLEDLA